jgi:hypothetical protein
MQSYALEKSITELEYFLRNQGYYDASEDDLENINQQILAKWDVPVKEAITNDLEAHLKGISIGKITNLFDLFANQGATEFISFVSLIDNNSTESLKIIIKSIVSHNKILTYLDSVYANDRAYSGRSKILGKIFASLKEADKQPDYFNPILFRSLLENKRLLT